jgi:hypothetical protein
VGDRVSPGSQNRGPRVDYSGTQAHPADEIVERLAWLMDGFIELPGGYRIGLDPIIGLIPGVGDLITTAVSSAIVFQAHRAGLSKPTLMRMVANVGIDAAVGAVPLVGDLFDFAFKANRKNLQLYREARSGAAKPGRDTGFVVVLLIALGAIFAIPVLLVVWLVQSLLG